MSTKPVPDEWARRMMKLGFSHRGEPSMSALARKADLSIETTRRFINRIGEAAPETIANISEAMREDMSWWVGGRRAGDVYVGPDQSRYLDERQRLALTELIHAFTKGAPSWPGGPALEESEPVPDTEEATDVYPLADPASSPEAGQQSPPVGRRQRPR